MQTKVKYNGQLKEPIWYVKHNGSGSQANEYAKYEGVGYPATEPPPPDTTGILGGLNNKGIYVEKTQTGDNIIGTAQVKNMSDASKTFVIENSIGGYSINCDFQNITGSDGNFNNIDATCNGSSGIIEIQNGNKIIGDFGSFSIEAGIGTAINDYFSNKYFEIGYEFNDAIPGTKFDYGTQRYDYGYTSLTVRIDDEDISVGYLEDNKSPYFYGFLLKQIGNKCEVYSVTYTLETHNIKIKATKSGNSWLSDWVYIESKPNKKDEIIRKNLYFSSSTQRDIWFSNSTLKFKYNNKVINFSMRIDTPNGDSSIFKAVMSGGSDSINLTVSYPMGEQDVLFKYSANPKNGFKIRLNRVIDKGLYLESSGFTVGNNLLDMNTIFDMGVN